MNLRGLNIIGLFSLVCYIFLCSVLATISFNSSFVLFGLGYVIIVAIVGWLIDKNCRTSFIAITYLFLLIYSIFALISYFIIYDNPLVDYLGDVDQIGYYEKALYLSKFSYSKIWLIAFNDFEYSESPLFNAWLGTIQKASKLDVYFGGLFQKLNVVFFSSFIPSILFLMIKKLAIKSTIAIKWSIIFGLFSFYFYYSGILLRDVHLALLYTWGFYLILKEEYSLKIYLTLILLGITSYYLRVESGLFFLGFFGIWLLNSSSNKKWLIGLLTLPSIVLAVLYIGGVENLIARTFGTIQGYEERGLKAASEDSLAATLSNLPIPLNWVSKFSYSQIYPFPIWSIFEGEVIKDLFHLPRFIGALFWVFVWTNIILNFKKGRRFITKYKWQIILALIYIFIVSQGQPYERRLIQTYPMIMLLFVGIGKVSYTRTFVYCSAFYGIILTLYLVLKFL